MGAVKCWKKYTVVVISSLLWDMLCLLLLFWSFEVQRSRARDNCWEDFKMNTVKWVRTFFASMLRL